ncbi:hypothetical protein TYRP_015117 [Tyrophagus putrescentiae]|nr:hypothetical protein TYRP_015117 [Tyrophagus putrescentiae]
MDEGVPQAKGGGEVVAAAEAEVRPPLNGNAEVVVKVKGGNLVPLLPQHEEDRVEEVDELRENRGEAGVEGRRLGGEKVQAEDLHEEVPVGEGHQEVVEDHRRLQGERRSGGHQPRADGGDEGGVEEEEGDGRRGGGHEGKVGHSRVAHLLPVLLQPVVKLKEKRR